MTRLFSIGRQSSVNWSGFRQEFGASEISENLWRREFGEQAEKRLNEGSRVSDARSILPAWGWGAAIPHRAIAALSPPFEDQTLSIAPCNNDGIPFSHRGEQQQPRKVYGSSIIGLWHRRSLPESDCRLAAVFAAEHSTRCACSLTVWPDTRDRSSGLFPAKSEPRKFRSGKDVEEGRRPGSDYLASATLRIQFWPTFSALKSFAAIFLAPFEMGLGKTPSSKLPFQTLLDGTATRFPEQIRRLINANNFLIT